jgi:hypothetical protein
MLNDDDLVGAQAYAAMCFFLESVHQRACSDDIGGLLGSLALLRDGSPADPALSRDWQEATQKALISPAPALTLM